MNTQKIKQFLTAVIACVTVAVVGMTMLMPTETYAASKPGQVKSVKVASKSYNSLKITWKKVKGAKGYQVYRATSKNGRYKKVKTTKSTTYTNSKLTTGKKYYYKIRAYKGRKKGKFSAKKSGTPRLTTTSVSAQTQNTSLIRVSWNKVAGAKGYQVYRSGGGGYTKVKTTSGTSYLDSGLAAGHMYSYKVRSYRKVGKSTKYSSYSSVRSARTKSVETPANPTKPTNPSEPTQPTNPPKEKNYHWEVNRGKMNQEPNWDPEQLSCNSFVSYGVKAVDSDGNVIKANWISENPQICSIDSDYYGRYNTLEPESKGSTYIKIVVDGKEYGRKKVTVIDNKAPWNVTINTGQELTMLMPVSELQAKMKGYGYSEEIYKSLIEGATDYCYTSPDKATYVIAQVDDGKMQSLYVGGPNWSYTYKGDSYKNGSLKDGGLTYENNGMKQVSGNGILFGLSGEMEYLGAYALYVEETGFSPYTSVLCEKKFHLGYYTKEEQKEIAKGMEAEALGVSNVMRCQAGRTPFEGIDPVMTSMAQKSTAYILSTGEFQHWSMLWSTWEQEAIAENNVDPEYYNTHMYNENICVDYGGFGRSWDIVNAYWWSGGHRSTLLNSNYTRLGVNFATKGISGNPSTITYNSIFYL